MACQYNDPSQLHHECLTTRDVEAVYYHFDEANGLLDHQGIRDLFEKNIELTNIPSEAVQKFKDSFNSEWWTENNVDKHVIDNRIKEAVEILAIYQ